MPLPLLGFAFVCIALSLGLWRRQAWVWYAGWAVFLLFGIQLAAFTAETLAMAETRADAFFGCMCVAGIALFWTTIAIWWKRSRREFGRHRAGHSVAGDRREV